MKGITVPSLKSCLITFCIFLFAACVSSIFITSLIQSSQRADIAGPRLNFEGTVFREFLDSHSVFVAQASKKNCQVIFLGDSITSNWVNHPTLFSRAFGKYRTLIFGIPGDCTQHVLWRIENGELDGARPAVIVLLIGTNNVVVLDNSAVDIAAGIRNILLTIHYRSPGTKVILIGVLPRGFGLFDSFKQKKIKEINLLLSKYQDDFSVFFLDPESFFILPNGTVNKDLLPDLLHPNDKGYEILAELIKQKLDFLIP
jgi:lysophospholipase L1-like esterase